MNNFKFLINNDDLGVSIVENIFINHYMPNAQGDFVKVYLLGLKYCRNSDLSSISNNIIAKTLNILESDVKKAWEYWQNQGIISFEKEKEDNYIIKYYHISSLMLKGKTLPNNEDEPDTSVLQDMYKAVEFIYGRPLSQKELSTISSWLDDLLFIPEMILLLVEYCFDLGKRDINYLNRVALNWYDKKLTSYDEVMHYLSDYKVKREQYYKIMNYLGFNRSPTKAEINIMDKWLTDYNMSLEMIFEACKQTLAIDKPNFKYIDKILTEWNNKKYSKIEDIEDKKTISRKQSKEIKSSLGGYDYDLLEKKLEEKMWSENNE
ncbi:DnaD domain protein [Alkalibaculum sp. M08DMB]|uniref:DnaD domain protein n=1 Tax=Alkalibaculum sporogenes TaxID=2655001 RepID=A0A6A7K759_9FIRM|nr:DnaD domain protein [Alkalibaculum sporogenes]MPW25280.1 DnaD domain protein [Alkalibaculum sporogenes]